ncbi:MAG: hypothetical protein HYY16_12220 [Planctomycetes bacterium]|nr:hypothetical protein [Planctomycetota bacterium]
MSQPAADISSDTFFSSGPWTGYYVYGHTPGRHRMDLDLRFLNGLIDGAGVDDIAAFVIRGHYDGEKLEVRWHKRYATHDVFYRGFREGRGIWGTWEIGPFARGGFMIWPKGIGEGAEAVAEEEVSPPIPLTPEAPPCPPRTACLPRGR